MRCIQRTSASRLLIAGDTFEPDDSPLWRVDSGVLVVRHPGADPASRFHRLALPGDLVGIDRVAAGIGGLDTVALTPAQLRPLGETAARSSKILRAGLARAHARTCEAMRLRTGPAQDRVKLLLLMLSNADGRSGNDAVIHALPGLRDMASVLDVAPETVSRVLSGLRTLAVLERFDSGGAGFSREALAGHARQRGLSTGRVLEFAQPGVH